MKRSFHNIKEHWILALVCMAVLLTAIVFAVIVMKNAGSSDERHAVRQGYFLDTDYPVYVLEKGGNVLLELDGSKPPDLTWQAAFSDETVAALADGTNEASGKRKVTLTLAATGYTILSFTRSAQIGSVSYDAP